ncbi:MAG: hypothetical protein M1155_00030 [Patescibacteria group bacterium]|nr:hypothetical protein [Patescibacteria group bacterium]
MPKPNKSSVRESRPIKNEHEREEFGPGKEGLVICPVCKAVYYKKSWHHGTVHFEGRENTPVKFELCPADQMIKNKQYEGKIIVRNVPKELEAEMISLIKNAGDQAYERDAMHRLISIDKVAGELVALTTENELAASIAKKIGDAHNKAKVKIAYKAEPSDVCLAVVEF